MRGGVGVGVGVGVEKRSARLDNELFDKTQE